MDVLLFRALALLGLAILVALAARRLRLPYTVGLVLAGAALAATRIDAGLALTHDLIFDVVLPPLLFEAALNACDHPLYKERYERTKKRLGRQRGPKVAQIDLSRKLTEAIWHMLTRNQPFAPAGAPFRLAA